MTVRAPTVRAASDVLGPAPATPTPAPRSVGVGVAIVAGAAVGATGAGLLRRRTA